MPDIILVRGKAGTGKTTLAGALAAKLRIPVLHKDDLYDTVAGDVLEHERRNAICFDYLYRFMANTIRAGADIVVDYGFNDAEDARRFRDWTAVQGGTLVPIRCVCSDESVWAARLAARRADPRPNQRITDLAELKAHYAGVDDSLLEGELVVDTVHPLETIIGRIESFFS